MKSSVKARIFFGFFNASGRTISELQNVRLIWKVFLDFGNQGYVKVYKLFLYTKIDRAVFDVTDVNYVNTDLAIVVSQWMNDNWHEFWSEFEPTIIDGFSEYFIEFANDKLNALRVRYDDLFLPEDYGDPRL
ncbi:uncharacterized protein LOC124459761 [Drosophila willistoni]|uniref:uncharacterized protein LOC124459761 n=1 Tax=Drosophila willistoni TaxID=7260 RepID=UPI001F076FD2|nr:uncharacterized protein LOC124459761 [Drosophila willistoni]